MFTVLQKSVIMVQNIIIIRSVLGLITQSSVVYSIEEGHLIHSIPWHEILSLIYPRTNGQSGV